MVLLERMVAVADKAVAIVEPILPHVSVILTALILSGALTQLIKWSWRAYRKTLPKWGPVERQLERLAIQWLAALLAFVPAYSMWEWGHPFAYALAIGATSPFLYQATIGLAAHKWPVLHEIFSARPEES